MKISLIFMLLLLFSHSSYSDHRHDYHSFIKSQAIKAYTKNSPQYRIVVKFGSQLEKVNTYRKKAAYIAIESDKCDFVISSDVVGEKYLEYEVICQNGAIIYLSETDLGRHKSSNNASLNSIIPEREKALPRDIAKSRCEQLLNNYVSKQKTAQQQHIQIDRYKIVTLITELGETMVRIGFNINNQQFYQAECVFRQNHKDRFVVKNKQASK